jgi:hypothetical protein
MNTDGHRWEQVKGEAVTRTGKERGDLTADKRRWTQMKADESQIGSVHREMPSFIRMKPLAITNMKKLPALVAVPALTTSLSAQTPPKRELAKAVLSELGVASRFDAYPAGGADQAAEGDDRHPKFRQWLQGLRVRELGWTKVEEAYIAHFESKFSEAELKELLVLSKNPTVRKLLNEELDAYRATFDQRNKMFAVFWRRYNALEFSPPDDATK